MDVVIFSPFQLFGECLERCLMALEDIEVVAVVHDESTLRRVIDRFPVDLLLVDVNPGFDCGRFATLAGDYPALVSLAVGLPEHEAAVVQCGRIGFSGYVPRDAPLATLGERMRECVGGRLSCPDVIAASLLRALRDTEASTHMQDEPEPQLVRIKLSTREIAVAGLLRRGYANKEIARDLDISVATVKHHVHSILEKLGLPGRVHVARAEPDPSWGLGTAPHQASVHALKRA